MKSAHRDAQDFETRTGSKWADSKEVKVCTRCGDKFTLINRKHHCRQCGQVVCKKCSPDRVIICDNKVRICVSCASSTGISARVAEDSQACLICRLISKPTPEPLLKDTFRQNVTVCWHKSCAQCRTCGTRKDLRQLHVNPPIGSTLHTVPGIEVHCFCNDHVSDFEALQAISRQRNPIPQAISIEGDQRNLPPRKISYGEADSQYFHLYIPREAVRTGTSVTSTASTPAGRSVPLAVVIHGGFWKSKYGVENSAIDTLPSFLLSAGMAVCLVEYRRVGAMSPEDEGGYPATNDDILRALRKLNEVITEQQSNSSSGTVSHTRSAVNGWTGNGSSASSGKYSAGVAAVRLVKVDMNRVVLIGHSAGGYLGLWACCHLSSRSLPFTPALCVAISPVCDLGEACRRKLSDDGDAVEKFMKIPFDTGSPTSMAKYNEACPSKMLPLEVPTIIAIGTNDADIPADMVEDFYWYAKKIGGEASTRGVQAAVSFSGDSGDSPVATLATKTDEVKSEMVVINDQSRDDNLSPPTPPPVMTRPRVSTDKPKNATESKQKRAASCVVPVAIKLVKLKDADHYDVVNTATSAWGIIFDEMNMMAPSLSDIPQLDTSAELLENVLLPLSLPDLSQLPCDGVRKQVCTDVRAVLAESPLPSRILSTAASGSSTPIRSVPERWVSDLHIDDEDGQVPYGDDSDNSSSSSDDDQFDTVRKSASKKTVTRNRRRADSHNTDECRDERSSGGVAENRGPSESAEAEIFFFPTPKSDRPRRHHSFNFRFGRQER